MVSFRLVVWLVLWSVLVSFCQFVGWLFVYFVFDLLRCLLVLVSFIVSVMLSGVVILVSFMISCFVSFC